MWVRFTRQFRFRATSQAIIRYPGGVKMNVPSRAAEAAIAAGAAVKLPKQKTTSDGASPEQPERN